MEITIAINLTDKFGSHQSNVGIILIENDNDILDKINLLLDKHHFHYINENGDIKKSDTDMTDLIKYNPTFYVYYNY
jgi:methyl coenzyme M reductase subunit D